MAIMTDLEKLTHTQYLSIIALVNTWGDTFPLKYYMQISGIDMGEDILKNSLSKYGWILDIEKRTIHYE